jgi:hypothetical protein
MDVEWLLILMALLGAASGVQVLLLIRSHASTTRAVQQIEELRAFEPASIEADRPDGTRLMVLAREAAPARWAGRWSP